MVKTRKEKFEKTLLLLQKCKNFLSGLKGESLNELYGSSINKVEKWNCVENYINQDESIELTKEEKVNLFIAFHEIILEVSESEKKLKSIGEFIDFEKFKEEIKILSDCIDEILSVVNF